MNPAGLEHRVARLRRRIGARFLLRGAVAGAAVGCLAWGLLALAARVAGLATPRELLVYGLLVPTVALAAAGRMWPRRPSSAALLAALDDLNRAGGLLLSHRHPGSEAWLPTQPPPLLPDVRWHAPRVWLGLCATVLFTLGVLAVPQRLVVRTTARPLNLAPATQAISNTIETLRASELLPVETADALHRQLAQLDADASGTDPTRTLAALDHLRDGLDRQAEEALRQATTGAEATLAASALSAALAEAAGQADSNRLDEAVQELAAQLASLPQAEQLEARLSPELRAALADARLTPEQLRQLAQALQSLSAEQAAALRRLCESGALARQACQGAMGLCTNGAACAAAALAACLGQNPGSALAECLLGQPGRGGVSRGRGDAPLTLGAESPEAGVRFRDQALASAALAADGSSVRLGTSATAPEVEPAGTAAVAGTLAGAQAGGGAARLATVLPRHRAAVQAYLQPEPPP